MDYRMRLLLSMTAEATVTLALLIEVLNATANSAGTLTHKITAPARESSEISIYQAMELFSPVITIVNDMTFTLLLCLYMLGTRVRLS